MQFRRRPTQTREVFKNASWSSKFRNKAAMGAGLMHNMQATLTVPLKPSQHAEACRGGTNPGCTSGPDSPSCCASSFGFTILAINCGAAVYHSWGDPWTVAFVLASFLILVSLFVALRVFETLPRESPRRAHAKATVWTLTTALTLMFSQRVAALMPLPAAVVVWVMAGSTISAGFYVCFLCPDGAATVEEEPAKLADMA
ncbi:hypothetical protein ACP4OV_030364 [Aristida adscensionis]